MLGIASISAVTLFKNSRQIVRRHQLLEMRNETAIFVQRVGPLHNSTRAFDLTEGEQPRSGLNAAFGLPANVEYLHAQRRPTPTGKY